MKLSKLALIIPAAILFSNGVQANDNVSFNVHVESDHQQVIESNVSLWLAQAGQSPEVIAEGKSGKTGDVSFTDINKKAGDIYYLTAKGGKIDGEVVNNYSSLSILNHEQQGDVVLNEITTIGSIWPNAQLLSKNGELSGSKNGLLIGSEQVQNLTNLKTGSFGDTALDGANVADSETIGRMNTLAALTTLCGAEQSRDKCDDFLEVTSSDNTIEALVKIAKTPYMHNDELFDLFKTAYTYPKGEQRRDTDYLPYLSYQPDDFALMVRITGGGTYSPGRMMFDNQGQLWSGQNWMPGSQSGLNTAIGGGVVRLAPSGKALSPALVGYNDQGLDGIGWGTTVSEDKVWVATFNAKVGVFDLNGKALGPATIDAPNGQLQGLATAPNGDVWVTDNQLNQMIVFPGGDYTKGHIVKVPGLKRPFAVAVDNNNVVWVTNNGSMTVTRFEAGKPNEAIQIKTGIAPRGLAIDSVGNVWVGANLSPGYPLPKIPKGTSIIDEFRISVNNIFAHQAAIPKTGNVTMISPDGKVVKSNLLDNDIYAAWGVSIDGGDNVFVGDFLGTGFIQMCGENVSNCPAGVTTGEQVHSYKSGIMQETTDTMIDDAGNVWVANNWNVIPALLDKNPDRRTATMGGGNGMVVVYGIAQPVQNPLIGQVRPIN
ncbi:hypothetical protein CWN94_10700 [Vibrio splendidus]|uniref:hypothetical protein n=1 Tax=Vibrio splendidus TaxID=29497 RepID=UPI000D332094|nr:hypothetical protein [Vibrio splendidus]PTO54272.1 hypothetical protein CWN94_10700 [Vibrio splendidus]